MKNIIQELYKIADETIKKKYSYVKEIDWTFLKVCVDRLGLPVMRMGEWVRHKHEINFYRWFLKLVKELIITSEFTRMKPAVTEKLRAVMKEVSKEIGELEKEAKPEVEKEEEDFLSL